MAKVATTWVRALMGRKPEHQFLHLSCGCDKEVVDKSLVGDRFWCVEHQRFVNVTSRMPTF